MSNIHLIYYVWVQINNKRQLVVTITSQSQHSRAGRDVLPCQHFLSAVRSHPPLPVWPEERRLCPVQRSWSCPCWRGRGRRHLPSRSSTWFWRRRSPALPDWPAGRGRKHGCYLETNGGNTWALLFIWRPKPPAAGSWRASLNSVWVFYVCLQLNMFQADSSVSPSRSCFWCCAAFHGGNTQKLFILRVCNVLRSFLERINIIWHWLHLTVFPGCCPANFTQTLRVKLSRNETQLRIVGVSLTFESHQLVVTFLPQVHLSLVFTQQLLIGTAHLADHLTDLTHTHTHTHTLMTQTEWNHVNWLEWWVVTCGM